MHDRPSPAERMLRGVAQKQAGLERARLGPGFWSSISVLGVVGWSVTVPTLAGVVAGIWLDHHFPARFSWTVTLLFGGLAAGCVNAWIQIRGKT